MNIIEDLLKRGIADRAEIGCVGAHFQTKLPNGMTYFATYLNGDFRQYEGVWGSDLELWSSVPASEKTQEAVVDWLTEVEDGVPAYPEKKLAINYFKA